jgi:uncharacterized protein YecT (DUF1311 family)
MRKPVAEVVLPLGLASLAALLVVARPARAVDELYDVDEICKSTHVEFPDRDRPTAAEKTALQGCNAEALYYGIRKRSDFVQARKCAFVELQTGDSPPFGGDALLMQIYANGKGTSRNDDLAIALACRVDSAPAELEARVKHLLERKEKGAVVRDRFDICDDITSGLMQGVCAYRDYEIGAPILEERKKAAVVGMPPAELFRLDNAAKAFFKSRSDAEVDQSGTARAAFRIAERAGLEDSYVAALERLHEKQGPPAETDFKTADAKLNRVYRSIMKRKLDYGTVTNEGVRATERLWITYRDAWGDLAASEGQSAEAWKAWLTQQRVKMLSDFAE